MKKSLEPLAGAGSLRLPDPVSGLFVAALEPVSVSACQRHRSGSTRVVVGADVFQGIFLQKSSKYEGRRCKVIVKPLQHTKPYRVVY
jgi:hypothetical protein